MLSRQSGVASLQGLHTDADVHGTIDIVVGDVALPLVFRNCNERAAAYYAAYLEMQSPWYEIRVGGTVEGAYIKYDRFQVWRAHIGCYDGAKVVEVLDKTWRTCVP